MKNKRTCDYIAEAIQNEILSGRMEAGEPLRQEELAETLGFSRIPIREALQILENQGLVRRLETRHVVVADFSEKVMDEIFELICRVQQRAILDMAEDETEWEMAVEEEEDFHTFIYTCISNEFFRKLLETAADCFMKLKMGKMLQRGRREYRSWRLYGRHMEKVIPERWNRSWKHIMDC